ncbi:MAG: DUF3078 domain-containing protein [Bacteroidales bacterium]
MTLKKLIFFLILFSFLANVSGQVTDAEKQLRAQSADTVAGWRKGGITSITLAQTSLTNWAAGGENSVAANGILSLFANYKKEKIVWDNSLDLGYGLLKQAKDKKPKKTDDKLEVLSKFGYKAFENVYYSALLSLKTQMDKGYAYPNDSVSISGLFAPAYLLAAAGLDYKPSAYLSMFISPLTSRTTIVNDSRLSSLGAFGVEPGKKAREELGGYLRLIYSKNDFKTEFLKNIAFTTKLDLFSNYLDKPQNVDVNWETLIVMKVNKLISVNLNLNLVYDDNTKVPVDRNNDGVKEGTGVRTQFKEIFGAGLSFKF